MGFIYKIVNDINDKVYIGQTSGTIEERYKQHLKKIHSEDRKTYPLYNAMRKYGAEHFHIEMVEETQDLQNREQYWIQFFDSYSNGYNATRGGDGWVRTDYDLIAQLYSEGKTGIEIANEIGVTKNTVYRALKAKGVKTLSNTEASKKVNSKPVGQYDKETMELIQIFSSLTDAAKAIGGNRIHISRCAKGEKASAYGYKWRFI